jgi:hypothetical protein
MVEDQDHFYALNDRGTIVLNRGLPNVKTIVVPPGRNRKRAVYRNRNSDAIVTNSLRFVGRGSK